MNPEPVFQPTIYDLKRPDEARACRLLMEAERAPARIDHIELMIAEWIKTCNPSKAYSPDVLNEVPQLKWNDCSGLGWYKTPTRLLSAEMTGV